MSKLIDLTGQKYGRLTVVCRNGSNESKRALWLCKCECGNEITVIGDLLRNGHVQSCGCLRPDVITKHGCAKHNQVDRLYRVWKQIRNRCNNPNVKGYKYYGGRGIQICDEWNDYENFRKWAIANGYDEKAKWGDCTIDRIDSNGNYKPDNCRWVDMKTQSNNKSTNHYITYNNETHTLAEWERLTGISRSVITCRIKRGWSVEKTFTTPVRKIKKTNK
jgi:hypothetical protein